MNYTCPKCGKKMDLSVEALIDSQYKVTCPECRSELQIVGDYAYIPNESLELDATVEPSQTINCPKCGREMSSNAHFCPNCGFSADSAAPTPPSEAGGAVVDGLTPTAPPPPPGADPLFNEVVEYLKGCPSITPMMLRDRFHLTDDRAAELIRQLEAAGIIGPYNHGGPRQILIPHQDLMMRNPRGVVNPGDSTAQGQQQGMPRRGGIGCVTLFVIIALIIMTAKACAG